jgi:translocation and assembly module TamB
VPTGDIIASGGSIDVLGRMYEVESARLVFDGSADADPALEVRISREFPNARVLVEMHGTLRKPELRLTSSPAIYERSQLLALVLTGREEAVSSTGAGGTSAGSTTQAVASSVAAALVGPLASKLFRQIGIDVVRLGLDRNTSTSRAASVLGDNRASLELGKYLTDRLYIGARGVLGASDQENAYEARLEYGLTRRLRLESVFGDRGVGGLDLMWRLSY